MHIYFTLRPRGELILPVHYNHIVQGAVYKAVDPELASFLHEHGYDSSGRRFKLFTFSRLTGPFQLDREKKTFAFTGDIELTVSSPVEEFCRSIASGLLTRGVLRLGRGEVEVEKMVVQQFGVTEEEIKVQTLSPVVAYSTLLRPDGRKYTCYYQPGEPDFTPLIEGNLRKKFKALYGREAPPGEVQVRKLGRVQLNIVEYKGTVIKGYSGRLLLTGPQELLQLAVDAGLGSKNAQGFGCLEVVGG